VWRRKLCYLLEIIYLFAYCISLDQIRLCTYVLALRSTVPQQSHIRCLKGLDQEWEAESQFTWLMSWLLYIEISQSFADISSRQGTLILVLAIVESLFRWRLSVGERWVEWKLCERTNNYLWTALNYLNISPKLQILCTYCSPWYFHLSASLLHVDCRLSVLQIFCDFHIEYLAALTPWTELASAALPA